MFFFIRFSFSYSLHEVVFPVFAAVLVTCSRERVFVEEIIVRVLLLPLLFLVLLCFLEFLLFLDVDSVSQFGTSHDAIEKVMWM